MGPLLGPSLGPISPFPLAALKLDEIDQNALLPNQKNYFFTNFDVSHAYVTQSVQNLCNKMSPAEQLPILTRYFVMWVRFEMYKYAKFFFFINYYGYN